MKRTRFPFNTTISLAKADQIVNFICSNNRDSAVRLSSTAFGLTHGQMLDFIDRNSDMLPPKEAA